MKYIIFLLCLVLAFAPNPYGPNLSKRKVKRLPSPLNITAFLEGFSFALQAYDLAQGLSGCSSTVLETKGDFSLVPDLFRNHSGSLALELIEEDALSVLAKCIPLIDMIKNHVNDLIQMVSDPNFPSLARERIILHFPEILNDLAGLILSVRSDNYTNSGFFTGAVLNVILKGSTNSNPTLNLLSLDSNFTSPVTDFVKGYLETLKVWDSVPDGLQCLDEVVNFKDTLVQAVALVQQGKILEALELVAQTIEDDLPTCKNSVRDLKTLGEDFLQTVSQPGWSKLAGERVAENFFLLLQFGENGIRDLLHQDFYSAGKEFGKIPHLVLSGPDA